MLKKPQIVAPGGSFEKAIVAFNYGADSVYIAGAQFGLRKSADNFSYDQMQELCEFAHKKEKNVYVVINGFLHNNDIEDLKKYVKELTSLPINALIISDMGVFKVVQSLCDIPIHVSTQASVSNAYTAEMWKKCGAKRIVLAREVSLKEAKIIKDYTGLELELFIHGAMCASYSGKCVISNYTSGRDSNRGGCVQSCRHNFELHNESLPDSSYIMNAKDLMGINLVESYIQNGIDAVKIEGRMKSPLYVANASAQYRQSIDTAYSKLTNNTQQSTNNDPNPSKINTPLTDISNRGFSTGNLEKRADGESISSDWNGYKKSVDYIGIIKNSPTTEHPHYFLEVKTAFSKTETLWAIKKNGQSYPLTPNLIQDLNGNNLDTINANQVIQLRSNQLLEAHTVIKRVRS